jgi:Glycosyl transferases group 1/Glycosyltransferase Family 4
MATRRHMFREPIQSAGAGTPAVVAGRHEPKKKLLYLAVCDPDLEVTGATVRMGAFVRYLAQYYDVTLVNMAGSGHRVEAAIQERFRDRDNRLGVTRRVRVDFSRAGYFLLSPALYQAANAFLRNEPFDYLLADYGLAAVYGSLFSRRYHIPLIYSSHNVEYRMYRDLSAHDFRRSVLAHYVYWAERTACRVAKLVITISENDRGQYARWISKDRIVVIPQGFEPQVANPFYDAPAYSRPVVLFVGSFRSENNRVAARRIVEEIAPAVHRTRADVRFLLIGADPPSYLKGPNIECPGFVDDLNPHMKRANLVIAPLPFAHGMATKIVSALACGKTILSTPEAAAGMVGAYKQLEIAQLEAFPSRIVELLASRPAVDPSDFSALKAEYAWPNLMTRLYERIEACCAGSTPCRSLQPRCGGLPWQ